MRGNDVILPEEVQNQIGRALRLKPGDRIIVLDQSGYEYLLGLDLTPNGKFLGKVLSKEKNTAEPKVHLNLYIAMTQREKLEWILQKGTEIGVCEFHPFICRRSLVQDADFLGKKQARRQKILQEAAEQCGRGHVPRLFPPLNLEAAVYEAVRESSLVLVAWEGERQVNLKQILDEHYKDKGSVALFIGPEGGFDKQEIELMHREGVRTFSLGKRILRMETAAVLAPALVLYQLCEMSI